VYYILYLKEKSLIDFKIDSHKIEEFKDKNGKLWVDDSKATNVDATINAIRKYKNKNIALILGGDSKGQNLTPLFDEIKDYNITLYLIGKDMPLFEKLAKQYKIKHYLNKTLENAVKEIKKTNFDVALLSPASASLDQFNSYKERGEVFKKLVNFN